jgi:signal transduction histidine kinase
LQRTLLDTGIWCGPGDEAVLQNILSNNGRLTAREMCIRHASGRVATVVFSAEVMHVGGEKCVMFAGLDTTARKEAESRQRAILRALPDWVFLMDATGVYLEFYGTDRGLLLPPDSFIGKHYSEVLPPELAARVKVLTENARHSDETVTMEYSIRIGDEDRFYEVRAVRTDRDRILCLVRDVTDRRKAETRAVELRDELAHAGRAMTLGVLSGSLAHEVNQPLAAISANAFVAMRLLATQAPAVDQLRELLADIMSDTRRIDDVLRKLRQLLRKDRREYALVDINAIVDDVMKLVHGNLVDRQITIETALGSGLAQVYGDRVQLQQVVLNFLMNAAEAVSVAPAPDRRIMVTTEMAAARVRVCVSDCGAVVSDAAFDRMFEPFFSTKPDGMGLGLSISRTIVEAHDGEIAAKRNADSGITCWFELDGVNAPLADAPNGATAVLADARGE